MTPTDLQEWLGTHGHPVAVDGSIGPQSRSALVAAFTNSCAEKISDAALDNLADRLGCSAKQLMAVSMVESAGSGFDKHGRPKLLFERHLFYRFTDGRFGGSAWSHPKGGGYNEDSWDKLGRAAAQDVDAAFASASWGKFQVLGAHCGNPPRKGFLDLDYPSSLEMAYSTVTGEAAHYEMLARYIEKAGLNEALQNLSIDPEDNRAFAKGYNGPNYHQFDYHNKLARAMF